jgi:hypothetical protein
VLVGSIARAGFGAAESLRIGVTRRPAIGYNGLSADVAELVDAQDLKS